MYQKFLRIICMQADPHTSSIETIGEKLWFLHQRVPQNQRHHLWNNSRKYSQSKAIAGLKMIFPKTNLVSGQLRLNELPVARLFCYFPFLLSLTAQSTAQPCFLNILWVTCGDWSCITWSLSTLPGLCKRWTSANISKSQTVLALAKSPDSSCLNARPNGLTCYILRSHFIQMNITIQFLPLPPLQVYAICSPGGLRMIISLKTWTEKSDTFFSISWHWINLKATVISHFPLFITWTACFASIHRRTHIWFLCD